MQKIIIFGFPHCGTTILKSIIGHIDEVYEIVEEMTVIPINLKIDKNKQFILCKYPFMYDYFFSEEYKDYKKIFILRNPLWVFSSLNKRFLENIPINHHIENYIYICSKFIKYKLNPKKNLFLIKYEELFDNNYQNLKNILNQIGLNYTDKIFDNTQYLNKSHNYLDLNKSTNLISNTIQNKFVNINTITNLEHEEWRTLQINKPFINNNTIDKLSLYSNQYLKIKNNIIINMLYEIN